MVSLPERNKAPESAKSVLCPRICFLPIMTCVDHDVRRTCNGYVKNARVPNLDYDTVYDADDTILFPTSAQALNELIVHVE